MSMTMGVIASARRRTGGLTGGSASISGTPAVGQTLTATSTGWSATPDSYTYQWQRAGADISGATASTYPVTSGSYGQTLSVVVTAIKAGYTDTSATSAQTAAVAAPVGSFVYDTFDEAALTELSLHTGQLGATWTLVSGNTGSAYIDAASGRVRAGSTAGGSYLASATPPSANYAVDAEMRVRSNIANATVSIAVRHDAATANVYNFRYSQSAGNWALTKTVSGSGTTTLGSVTAGLTVAQLYMLRLVADGSTISAFVDNMTTPLITVTDTSITGAGQARLGFAGAVGTSTAGYAFEAFSAHTL